MDDGSTDPHTLEVLDGLAATGITVVRKANGGPASARTAGLDAVHEPFVLALDADDRLAPGVLGRLVDAVEATPNAAAAWGDARAFGTINWLFPTWPVLDPWLVTYLNRLPLAAVYRREALAEIGGWTLTEGYEDWDVWQSLAGHGWTGVHIGEVHVEYRQHEGRRLGQDLRRHDRLAASLAQRHTALYGARRATARVSPAPLAVRTAFACIDRLPGLSERRRHRWHDITLRSLVPATRAVVDGVPEPSPARRLRQRLLRRRQAGATSGTVRGRD